MKSGDAEAAVFAAELGDAISLDLHGLDVESAKHELDSFLNREFMQGTRVVKIIHGRGAEKLRRMVEQRLTKTPFVDYSRGAQSPSQQGAITYAVLAKK